MAKFTGFMCDVCNCTATGESKPDWWMTLKLPGSNGDAHRDICSDKCLLKFARDRSSASSWTAPDGLTAYLDQHNIKPSGRGAITAQHARLRHEMTGGEDDCLVCQFLAAG